jgi:hypothetical protein
LLNVGLLSFKIDAARGLGRLKGYAIAAGRHWAAGGVVMYRKGDLAGIYAEH